MSRLFVMSQTNATHVYTICQTVHIFIVNFRGLQSENFSYRGSPNCGPHFSVTNYDGNFKVIQHLFRYTKDTSDDALEILYRVYDCTIEEVSWFSTE